MLQPLQNALLREGLFLGAVPTEGISTSELVRRVICNWDEYVERNIERGYTPKQLDIGLLELWAHKLRRRRRALTPMES